MASDRGPPSERVGGGGRPGPTPLGGRGLIIATKSNLQITVIDSRTITSHIWALHFVPKALRSNRIMLTQA